MNVQACIDWLALAPDDLLAQCRRTSYQASGPGGQKRNRVYSAMRLDHPPSELRAESGAHREAARNLKDALHKLRLQLALHGARLFAPDSGESFEYPAGFAAFRMPINPGHADFPPNVLRALLAFRVHGCEPRGAAESLGVSTSALVRFLKLEKSVLALANDWRRAAGKDSLR